MVNIDEDDDDVNENDDDDECSPRQEICCDWSQTIQVNKGSIAIHG